MPIKFHCEHCGKTISAPDSAGGRRGRCPNCKEVVYIPSPDVEEIALSPLDEQEEQRRRRLVEENLRREHDLLMAQGKREAVSPDDLAELDSRRGEGGVALPEVAPSARPAEPSTDVNELVVIYLAHLVAGRLDAAAAVARQLRADRKAAQAAVDAFLSDPIGDKRLADVPPPVLGGFVKQLQQELK